VIDRRTFIGSAAYALIAAPLSARAKQPERLRRIGVLGVDGPMVPATVALLNSMLAKLGWIEGKNFVWEGRYANYRDELLPELAAELMRLDVDVILTVGTQAPLVAKQATTRIPIVIYNAGDAVELGLAASLARPGGNITGLSWMFLGLSGKRLQFLTEMLPSAARLSLLYEQRNGMSERACNEAEEVGGRLGIHVESVAVRHPDEIETALESIRRQRPDALMVVESTLLFRQRVRIVEFAAANRLPGMYQIREFADAGGLITYGPSFVWTLALVVGYIDKILRGAKPADLPIEQPTKVELVINLKTAKALGLTIPQSLLVRADEVIQ
jgi:putative ABC transport system substrate-binding protein